MFHSGDQFLHSVKSMNSFLALWSTETGYMIPKTFMGTFLWAPDDVHVKTTLHRSRTTGAIIGWCALSGEDTRKGAFITKVGRPLESATFIELTNIQFGGRREVPHDHSCGVYWHHKVSGVSQSNGLVGEDIKDLWESKGVKVSDSPDELEPVLFITCVLWINKLVWELLNQTWFQF